jgi:phosphatidate cytidylyltransferase
VTNLLSRVLVALVALPAVLLLVWQGGWWLFGLVAAAALVGLHEYTTMVRELRPLVLGCYLSAILMLLGVMLGGVPWLLGGFLGGILVAFVLYGVADTRQPATVAIGSSVLGTAWVVFGLAHLILLREVEEYGVLLVFTVLLAVFAADTLAYFVGRLVGRHKLAPVMSPGKTWEGFAAGLVGAVGVAFFALYEDRDEFLAIWQALVVGLVIALAAVLGDLFESALKRDMKVKDTGRILGGHGGVLDRIDSLLFVAPAAFYLVLAFGYGPG